MMQCTYFSTQESGPDEDHQVQSPNFQKVLDDEDQSLCWNRGIFGVDKGSHVIEEFIDNIPMLVRQDGTYGLIWNKSLQPSDGRYESGEHFCRTREQERKSANGFVSFYRDGETGQKFAIKTLQDSDHFHSWEIKIGLVCSSPHLCAVYGVIVRNNKIHILLEHAGLELNKERSWIAESPERILTFAKQSFQALEDLHGYGYVHCDIKPDNIMIVRDQGDPFTVKLIDFGSCQPKGGVLPPDAHTTRFYWSPEIWQSLNHGDQVICQPAMDVYALALTLYFVQTAGHLMNLLQERDILPLMTQRSEDLLLIALPETIPSGLRAVMRPCLAGRAEDRWSAKQAANQLDGDAMMQRALSNPRGENYKDLFQQLLRNQSEKNNSQSSETFTLQSPIFSMSDQATSSHTRNEEQNTTENHSTIHFFVGGSKGTEKKEMGLHMKSVGSKAGVEKKQIPPPRVKRSGSINNGKWPKPRKIAMKGQVPLKQLKQARGLGSNNVSANLCAQDEQEVHYISSDETMPDPSKQESKTAEKAKCENCKTGIAQSDVKNKEEMFQKQDQITQSPNATRKLEPQMENRPKPVTMTTSESDETAFSCSALLITLASQARSSSEGIPPGQSTLPTPSTHCNLGKMFERDKARSKLPFLSATTSDTKISSVSTSLSDANELHGKTEENPLRPYQVQEAPDHYPDKALTDREKAVHATKVNISRAQASGDHQVIPTKPAAAREDNDDEMEFVFEALEIPQFTGRAEDILDNLCNMLDKDESKPISDIHIKKLVGEGLSRTLKEDKSKQYRDLEEPMEVSDGSTERSSLSLLREKSRKRISNGASSTIPAKIQARHDQSDAPTTEHLLPIFDEILPENVS